MSWVSIGPSSARRGQASTFPAISGRVSGIALPRRGRQVYIGTANGGVWRSDDLGVTWRPLMDRFDRNPRVGVNPTAINNRAVGIDTLACGAIAIHPDHPDTIFVGTGEAAAFEGSAPFYFGAGVAISTDAGLTWNIEEETTAQDGQPSTDMLGIGFYAMAVDPTDPAIVVTATTRGLYVRQQVGDNYLWSQRRLRPDIAGRDGSDLDVTSVVVAGVGANPPVFYAATRGNAGRSGQVYRSTDHGNTWTQLGLFPPPDDPFAELDGRVTLAVKHDDPDFLYARTASGLIFRWNGTGANQWNSIANLPGDIDDQGFYNLALAVDPANGERLFVGGATSLVTRPDGERIWSAIFYRLTVDLSVAAVAGDPDFIDTIDTVALGDSLHADIHAIAFRPGNNNELWVGGDGGIFFTRTPQAAAGNIFIQRNAGLATLLPHKITSHPRLESVIFAGTQDNGCVRYTGEECWYCMLHGDGGAIVVNRRHPERLRAVYTSNSLFHKADGGISNRMGSSRLITYTLNERVLFYPPLVGPPAPANDAEADRLAWGAERVWLSDDFADNFTALPTPPGRAILSSSPFSNANDTCVKSLCFGDQTHLFVGLMNGEIYYYTENPGAPTPWAAPQRLDNQPGLRHNGNPIRQVVTDIAADPRNVGACFITFGGFGDHPRLWYYDGANWHDRGGGNVDVNQNLMNVQANCLLVEAPDDAGQPLRLYMGADIGAWRSLDAGNTWELWANGLPDTAILDLDFFAPSRLIRAATFGRGIFERHLDDPTRNVHLYIRDHQLDTGRWASTLAAPDLASPLGPANLAAIETQARTDGRNAYNAALAAGQTENQARNAEFQAATDSYRNQLAAAPANHVAPHSSPDIKVDAPDAALSYQFSADECLDFLRFVDIFTDESQTVAYTDNTVNLQNRIYVQVHNRGGVWAHQVQVMLLIAAETGGAVPDLPEDFDYLVRSGTAINREGWRTIGIRQVSDLRAGHPQVARFSLYSDLLKELAGAGPPGTYQMLVILHHHDDPFATTHRAFTDLVANERLTASKLVTASLLAGVAIPAPSFRIANSWKPIGPAGVLRGQAGSQPTMSGRVSGLAVAPDGKRVYLATASGGVWRSDDQGRRWRPLMDSVNYDPEYTSQIGIQQLGITSLSCGAIAIAPGNPDKIFVGTGEAPGITYLGAGVLVSDDGGRHWQQEMHAGGVASSLLGAGFYSLAVDTASDQHEFLLGATNIGLYRRRQKTGAAGYEWQRIQVLTIAAGNRCTSVISSRRGGSTHFFAALPNHGADGQIFESWDQGANWQRVGTGYPTGKGRIALAVFLDQGSTARPDVIYTINDDGEVHRAERTSGVHGTTWSAWRQVSGTPDNIEKQGGYNRGFAMAPDNRNRIYIGGAWVWSNSEYSGFLYRCDISPSGSGFAMETTYIGNSIHPDLHTLVFAQNDPRQLWVGCDGGVFYTNNALAGEDLDNLFRACNDGLQTLQFNSIGLHPSQEAVILGGTQDNGALRYTGDEAWILSAGGDGGCAFINREDPNKFFSVYTFNEYRISTTSGSRYSYTSKSVNTGIADNARGGSMLFYPPYAYTPPATGAAGADTLAFGEKKVWLSTDFGDGDWTAITPDLGDIINSLAFAGTDLIYAGTLSGLIFKIEKSGGSWQPPVALHDASTNFSSITSIAVHPLHADRIYITMGGAGGPGGSRVEYHDGATWTDRTGTGGSRLLNAQINRLVIDPDNHDHLYVAADIGLWRSTNGGVDWQVFNTGIPETAVIDLAVFKAAGQKKLLRAVTHGRGMYEYTLDDADALGIELYLRDHQLDLGREGATSTYGAADPTDPGNNTAFGNSPDIKVDAPDDDGKYQFSDREELGFVDFIGHLTDNSSAVAVHRLPVNNHAYVLVHNRGAVPANGVEVVLLVSSVFTDTPPRLPENFRMTLLAGQAINNDDWKTVGRVQLDDIRVANPRTCRFNLPSDLLASGENIEDGKKHALAAFIFHERDRLTSDERTLATLANGDRHVAVRYLNTSSFSGTLPGVEQGIERNVPFMLPMGVSLLASQKISGLVDQLRHKQNNGAATFRDIDRSILALAEKSLTVIAETEDISSPRSLPCNGSFSRFVVMGCMAWNLPDYVDWLAPRPGWIGDMLKRGTPDPDLSHRSVKSAEFVMRMAEISLAATDDEEERKKIRAFSLGMLHALAANVALNPILRGLQADYGPEDWDHRAFTADEVAASSFVSRKMLDGVPETDNWRNWWPETEDVPEALFQGYIQAMTEMYDPQAARGRFFGAHADEDFAGPLPNAENLREGYDLFRRTLSPNLHWGWWLLILSPFFLMPSISLLIARYGLPEGRKLFTEEHGEPGEQSYYEVLSLTGFMASFAPFAYSMYLWSLSPRRNGHFTQALICGIGRILSGVFFTASYALSPPPAAYVRWPVFGLFSAADIWFLIRGIIHTADDEPGYARLNFLQTIPGMSMLANLLFCGLMQIKRNDIAFWILWVLWTVGAITGGVFAALNLAKADNLIALFRNRGQKYIGMDRLGRDTAYRPGKTLARVFSDQHMWHLGEANRDNQRYPSGPRSLVTLVAPEGATWSFSSDGHRLSIKDNSDTIRGPVVFSAPFTASAIATEISALAPELTVNVVDGGDLLYDLPYPDAFSDQGHSYETHQEHDLHLGDYQPISTDGDNPTGVCHAPRGVLAASMGIAGDKCSSDRRIRLLPEADNTDFSGTMIDRAADLAALLSLAAAPVLNGGTVAVAGGGGETNISAVQQVFRRWNLSERHIKEWRTLFGSGAEAESVDGSPVPPPPPGADGQPSRPDGAQVAAGLGWITAFNSWRAVATDAQQDSEAPHAGAAAPALRLDDEPPLRPTNRDLSGAMRYLFDLP